MIFIVLTFLAAFAIESLGTLVSVIGLSALFGSNPIIIALAISLDLGKIVVVSFLYTHWKKMGVIMKSYALLASVVTMIITSAGAAGYLSGEFQKAIAGTQESSLKIDVLKQQQAKFEERKKQIDDLVAKIPDKYTANQRIRVMNQFKAEQAELTAKIAAIDKQLPDLQIAQIGVEAKAGPILYIAKAFDIPVESAVKWVILLIIFVFDPLAIFLIIAGNFLLQHRRDAKINSEPTLFNDEDDIRVVPRSEATKAEELDVKLAKFDSVKHSGEWPRDIDEPGFGNSALRFDEQIEAAPKYDQAPFNLDIDKLLEDTHIEPAAIAPVTYKDMTDELWLDQDELIGKSPVERSLEREAEIKDSISSMVIEGGDSLPPVNSPEVLPEAAPIAEEVSEPIVEPPVEALAPIKEPSRETITLSSLGLAPTVPVHHATSLSDVKADPSTTVDASHDDQITRVKITSYPRPTKKLPAR